MKTLVMRKEVSTENNNIEINKKYNGTNKHGYTINFSYSGYAMHITQKQDKVKDAATKWDEME